jgi:hypothetical protein
VERLATVVLAVPSYQLMRQHHRVENGDLHPALSSLFRVTDGVRMTMHQMLFVPINEPTRSPRQVVTVDDILDYAERNLAFHSDHGVCAGPRAMVRDMIEVLLEGHGNADYASMALEPAVQAAIDDLDAAIDYGFHGLRAHAAVFALWPVMARAYEQIAATLEAWPRIDTPVVASLRESVRTQCELLPAMYLAPERWRASRDDGYADMYQQCGRGLKSLGNPPGLDVLLAPAWTSVHRRTEAEFQDILRNCCGQAGQAPEQFVLDLSAGVMDFLLRIQAVLRTAVAAQSHINRLLGREQPRRAITAADINAYNIMQGPNLRRLAYLIDELERLFGIRIDLDPDRLAITRRGPAA